MIRKFYLENRTGDRFDFQIPNKQLLADVSDLGFSQSNSVVNVEDINILTNVDTVLTSISGTLILNNYERYTDFMEFLDVNDKDDPFKFIYQPPNAAEEFATFVLVNTVSKTEIVNNRLDIPISFDRITNWFLDRNINVIINNASDGKEYAFKRPYKYVSSNKGTATIVVEGRNEVPLNIIIDGVAKDPSIQLFVNDVLYSVIDLTINVGVNEKVIINADPLDQKIVFVDSLGVETNIYDTQYIDFSKQIFIYMQRGVNKIVYTTDVAGAAVLLEYRIEKRGV